MLKILYSSFFLLLLCTGCLTNNKKSNQAGITGTWRLYDIEKINASSTNKDAFSEEVDLKQSVRAGEVLCFFKDGNYSKIKGKGEFNAGKWGFSDDNKTIHFNDSGQTGKPIAIKIEKDADGKMMLYLTFNEKNLSKKYVKESEAMKASADDPFHAENNQWRKKPQQAESSMLLLHRLNNYIKHLALILKSAKERKQEVISFEFSQGPVKIYNGGIGIHPYEIVPAIWKNSFYNDTDALKAYSEYETYLRNSTYRGAGIGNWIEDDYNILLSIYGDISQLKTKP